MQEQIIFVRMLFLQALRALNVISAYSTVHLTVVQLENLIDARLQTPKDPETLQ